MKIFRLLFLLFSVTIFALSAASLLSSVLSDDRDTEVSATDVPVSETYVVRSEGDSIAVFLAGENTPMGFLDVSVNDLPENDRLLLETGLLASDSAQLASIIEDYTG